MNRFWGKVDKTGECWLWKAGTNSKGYGRFRHNGEARLAHRVAYELEYGDVPSLLRHTCDNPACVNPDHLEPGTQADNLQDMADRGRGRKTHLPLNVVESVRAATGTQRQVAEQFGVSQSTVGRIRRGEV